MLRRLLLFTVVAAALGLLIGRARMPAPETSRTQSAGPLVVLVHGLGSRASDWRDVAANLERDHRVLLVDLPGHGVTRMPEPFGLPEAAAILDRAIADRTDEPVVLVGHSVGGLVAAAEALAHPQRVRALVLVETALRPQFTPAEARDLLASFDRDWTGTLRDVWSSFGRDSVQGAHLAAEAAAMDSAVLRPWIRLALSADLSREAASLRVPMRAVLAPHSWESGESWAHVAEALGYSAAPSVSAGRIDGSGHYVMLDRPDALADEIRRTARGAGLAAFAARP